MKIIRANVLKNKQPQLCLVKDVCVENELCFILLASSNDPNTSILSLVLFRCQWRDDALY